MYDLTITYSPIGFNPPQVETVPKIVTYELTKVFLEIELNPTTRVFIPTDRIQKVEVEG